MAELNLFKAYINAWSNHEEDKFMEQLTYINKYLCKNHWNEWFDIKYFHKYFTIKSGWYYDADSDYAIGDTMGNAVWEGDYPTEEVMRKLINEL